jgi:excisionase family DNA binding protein
MLRNLQFSSLRAADLAAGSMACDGYRNCTAHALSAPDTEQAAAYLNVRPSWVRGAVQTRRIPHVKLGKHVRFLQEDLDSWIVQQREEARP